MIQREMIEGREATVAYITDAMEPVEPEDADLKKVIFDDGDVWFVRLDGIETEEVTDTEALAARASPEGASAGEVLAAMRARHEKPEKTAKRRAAIRAKLGVTKSPEERARIDREREEEESDIVPTPRGDPDAYDKRQGMLVRVAEFAKSKIVRDAWKEGDPRGQPENAGQFGPGGVSAKGEKEGVGDPAAAALLAQRKARELHPEVVEVGGDEWNKQTAIRLEHEYQDAKPKMDALLEDYAWGEDTGEDEDQEIDGDEDYMSDEPPEEWDHLPGGVQEKVAVEYYNNKLQDYIDGEVSNWQESGGALDEAKSTLAATTDFQYEAIKEWMTGMDDSGEGAVAWTETEFPFEYLDIADNISLYYASDGQGTGSLKVSFSDTGLHELGKKLKEDPKQLTLEGVKEPQYDKLLTKEMRIELTTMLKAKFQKAAEEKAPDLEAPEYLTDQAQEFMKENWEEHMSAEDKFGFAKYSTPIVNDLIQEIEQEKAEKGEHAEVTGVPNKYDPLNLTSGKDYRKTQKLARHLSISRAEEVFEERGIKLGMGMNAKKSLARLDHTLWDMWKASSTSEEGQLLQVATADELGGRLNQRTGRGGDTELIPDKIAKKADADYKQYGGYKGIKAYVRAKWETTQFLLDKAGHNELELYRGISLEPEPYQEAAAYAVPVFDYKHVPHIHVVRNGAASTSVSASVANNWSSDDQRIVLRAKIPRTAAVSVPAYGINVKSEQEVVVAGTAWKAWDAWIKKAPSFTDVPLEVMKAELGMKKNA